MKWRASTREKVITWTWMVGLTILYAEAMLFPILVLGFSQHLVDDDPTTISVRNMILSGVWGGFFFHTVMSKRMMRRFFWDRYCAEAEAEARPDDRENERAIHCGMEIRQVIEKYGFKDRPFVCFRYKEAALFYPDHHLDAHGHMRPVTR